MVRLRPTRTTGSNGSTLSCSCTLHACSDTNKRDEDAETRAPAFVRLLYPPPVSCPLLSSTRVRAMSAEPVAAVTLLGDTSEWENAAPDVDFDDDNSADVAAPGESGAGAGRGSQQCSASFVKEADEIASLLVRLPFDAASPDRLSAIFDEYQEQCELLDPHLPHTITTLMNYVHAIIRPGKSTPVPPINSTTGAIKLDAAPAPVAAPVTGEAACAPNVLLTRVFKVVYTLSKVRGYKTIVHFFPHEVADLEPTLALLQQQDMDAYETWETRYGLLLWMSVIVLIPFDLTTVDSSLTQDAQSTSSDATAGRVGIISSLISLGSRYLSDTGPPREGAAVMLAKLFSRADMHASHLGSFFRWSTDQLARVRDEATVRAAPKSVFLVTGIFRCLSEIFRHAPRDVLLRHVALVFEPILRGGDDDSASPWASSNNTLLRKLFIKLAQRVGLTYLPVRVAKWRYQRGHRSLLTTLQQQQANGQAAQAQAVNPLLGSSTTASSSVGADDDDEFVGDIPSEIEDLIQILLDGLRDRDTVVRWSSAKGIGRLTNCLPASFGDDVVEAVLDLFSGRESDGAWHGGCLALAELARRGLLLPARLAQVVPITLRALTYDQRTATHSIGAHVRDASCYVQWAFARAYAPEVMTPYMQSLASGLLTLSVFDREVNVRRAASAAFQEHVGRQGSASFKHGMAILQIADYFTVSNRANAYTSVAFEVAQYEEYTVGLIEHLLEFKVRHWEKEVRELTARTLGVLTNRNLLSRAFMRDVAVRSLLHTVATSNDLLEKHGAILAVAEVMLAMHQQKKKEDATSTEDGLAEELKLQVCTVLNSLMSASNAQLLNGRGGQIMREAICRLIEVIAQVGLLYTNAQTLALIRPYQLVLDENLAHTNAGVQTAAISAVEQFVRGYYLPLDGDDAPTKAAKLARAKPVMDNYVRTLAHPSSLAGTTRGFAAALGTMPRALLVTSSVSAQEVYSARPTAADNTATTSPLPPPPANAVIYQPLSRIIQTLVNASTECSQSDAETRRNAVQSLVRLMETITDDDITQWMTPMPPAPTTASSSAGASPPPASSSSSSLSAAREKELKAAQKAAKVQQELVNKYWQRDLHELGLPGNRISARVATALLVGLDDYATDNRGDVGSWVREAAMTGLESLLLKLARIQAVRSDTSHIFPPLLAERVFPALLKQAVEKIDRVRERSGQIFHRLLWSDAPAVPFVPLKDELRRRFPNRPTGSDQTIDWSSPTQTFPLLTPTMSITATASGTSFPYHRSLLSGLLISVGGLTESVVKSSSESLLEYVSGLSSSLSSDDDKAAHSLVLLKQLADDLLAILISEKGHARVIVPAFKTIEMLLSQNMLEPLTLEV